MLPSFSSFENKATTILPSSVTVATTATFLNDKFFDYWTTVF